MTTDTDQNDPYDIWVEFNDVEDGTVVAYLSPPVTVGVGQTLIAGDHEGNRCPATVTYAEITDGARVTLRLDMDRFRPAQPPAAR